MEKIWEIKKSTELPQEILKLAEDKVVAELLLQRGIDTEQKVKTFLNPLKMKISSPCAFVDMKKSVERIDKAIKNQEKIIVFGDFDCDGVTSTALLYKTLQFLGANVGYYVPTREFENHGLSTKALVKLIAKEKAKLFVTVDCGISNIEEVKFINGFNLDIIITDHHEAHETLPDAFAILNAKAPDSLDPDLPIDVIESLNHLAGVGVAFKLACALLEFYKKYDFVDELLPLVAVGTIADIVPLLGENRSFVASGLKLIEKGKNPGIQKLLEVAGYKVENGINSENIAFGVAPRINAAGRLESVDKALNLLISDNASQISVCAETLNNYNKIRQELSDTIFEEAIQKMQDEPPQSSIILFKEDWHIGIIGIVASRLVEKFFKPVLLMTKDENSGLIRCSSRSIKGVHLHQILEMHAELFEGFGGHAMAAGLYFDPKKTSFNKVKDLLTKAIDDIISENEVKPVIEIDMELASNDLNLNLLENLDKLQPFGAHNPNPVFVLKNLIFKQCTVMGANKNHLKIFAENDAKKPFECVYWNHNRLDLPQGARFDVVFYPKINSFNNMTTIQLDVQDIKSDSVKKEDGTDVPVIKVLDHRKKTGIYDQICDYMTTTKLTTAVFSEDKEISDFLAKYKLIAERLCDRINLKKCSQIMFFDYPSSLSLFKKICVKSSAKVFHLMNYENKKIDVEALMKKVSGMLKYVSNNRDGVVKISEMACFLGISEELTELCIDMFESLEMVEILDKDLNTAVGGDFLKIKFKNAVEIAKIKDSELYDALCDEAQKIYEFKESLLKAEVGEILEILES